MYRQPLHTCPGCASPMQQVTLHLGVSETARVHMCGPCGGGHFDYFAGEPSAIARALTNQCSVWGAGPRMLQAIDPMCPTCGDQLALLPYLEDGPLLYRCDLCLTAFATAHQLRELAIFEHTRKASQTTLRAVWERLEAWALRQAQGGPQR